MARQFTKDFEAVIGGLAVSDADPASAFYSAFVPGGSTNLSGIDDPELTKAVTEFKAASDLDSQKAALNHLQEVYNKAVPFAVLANSEEYVVVDDSVAGISPTLLDRPLRRRLRPGLTRSP